jgi:hypothetical protein
MMIAKMYFSSDSDEKYINKFSYIFNYLKLNFFDVGIYLFFALNNDTIRL